MLANLSLKAAVSTVCGESWTCDHFLEGERWEMAGKETNFGSTTWRATRILEACKRWWTSSSRELQTSGGILRREVGQYKDQGRLRPFVWHPLMLLRLFGRSSHCSYSTQARLVAGRPAVILYDIDESRKSHSGYTEPVGWRGDPLYRRNIPRNGAHTSGGRLDRRDRAFVRDDIDRV